ncbi:MAG: OmpA family protein [Ramlibacter sp.]|nr:OmpA family protein [Ramlibacter sp.]
MSGIYFDFAQATLLPQSTGTLQAVAEVMTANPGWSLRIEGHTDNVGGGAFNLTLSQRRAAAVRDALIAQFKVPAARLAATGFGLTRPVASNGSLVGRAANRRVELSRTCP